MSHTSAALGTSLVFMVAAAMPSVRAQTPAAELTPQVIDLGAMTEAQIGPILPNLGTIRSKSLVTVPSATVTLQAGDAPKHTHQQSVELQYVISGEGTVWLGGEEVHVHAGDLVIVPKGTAHGGSHSTRGALKMLVIKLPPSPAGDFQKVP